ncbi:MAG: hypothetical protein LLF76_10565 [Planctomycetaceae bacterium]|nr:hypothetical protein [Planctomycetaceae bacterium]
MPLRILVYKKLLLALLSLGLLASCAHAFPMASKRFPVTIGQRTFLFPYEASHNLEQTNPQIEHVILSVHCSGFDALRSYRNAEIAIEEARGDRQNYLILAPHFLTPQIIRERICDPDTTNVLYWRDNPFWGESNGLYNGNSVTVSAYDAIDQLLAEVVAGGHFPNLKDIIVMGLSAGGQMVNRYAASNTFEFDTARPHGIQVRYLVMAPSTYIYFSPQRLVGPKGGLQVPIHAPSDYNSWGYGLDYLWEYHKRHGVTAQWIRNHYSQRQILYLVGGKDVDFSDKMLAKNPSAMLQGANRLQRGYNYMTYLTKFYGDSIEQTQKFYEIPGIAHSDRPLINSPQGLAFIFHTDPGQQIAKVPDDITKVPDDTKTEPRPLISK